MPAHNRGRRPRLQQRRPGNGLFCSRLRRGRLSGGEYFNGLRVLVPANGTSRRTKPWRRARMTHVAEHGHEQSVLLDARGPVPVPADGQHGRGRLVHVVTRAGIVEAGGALRVRDPMLLADRGMRQHLPADRNDASDIHRREPVRREPAAVHAEHGCPIPAGGMAREEQPAGGVAEVPERAGRPGATSRLVRFRRPLSGSARTELAGSARTATGKRRSLAVRGHFVYNMPVCP